MSPNSPDDKDKIDTYHGITLEVNGEVIGRIEKWDPKHLDETGYWPKKYTDIVSRIPSLNQGSPGMHQISFPVGSISKFFGPECSGKSNIEMTALRNLLEPGHLYISAQLAMWGFENTGEVCEDCLAEIVTTLGDMGYNVWFDEKSTIDEDLAAAHGVVMRDYKLSYVGVGEEDEK